MEVVLVSGILKTVGTKLAFLVTKELSSITGVAKDLQELQDRVEEINIWLQTVGNQAKTNHQPSNWLRKLKDAAYDSEDLVHEFHMEAEKHDATVACVKNNVVKYLWTKPKSVVFKCKIAHKIIAINDYSTIANSMPMPIDHPVLHLVEKLFEAIAEVDSWKVFQQSFGISMKGLDHEFLQIGMEIVKKCGGMPLAIKVLAGVLRGMKRIEEWESIRDTNLLDVADDEHRVSACLWLSYYHLPHHLKACFAYCSIFPRAYVISRRRLISQWIAHGLVNLTNQVQQPEDVGLSYFDSLLKVSFLQDAEEYNSSSEVTTCKMHDLVHDLTRHILQDEFVSEVATNGQKKRCRYLSLTSYNEVDSKLFEKVHALFVSKSKLAFGKTTNKCYCARTMVLNRISATSLLPFISKFEHLGYLEISEANCEELPEAIAHCWSLQAIHVINCRIFAMLPESIGKLKKLRTLELVRALEVKSLPQSIGQSDNLQSLYLHDFEQEKEEVSLLDMEKDLDVLNSLEPPSEIEKLGISGYRGLQLPHWITKRSGSCALFDIHMLKGSNLPRFSLLSKLVLENLPNMEHLQGLADLPGIKILKLRGMPKLGLLTTTTSSGKGEEEDGVQYCFPQLSTLVISDCPKLNVKPYFPPSLRELTLEGSIEQLLSSGSFFRPCHAHGDGVSSPSSCTVKPPHITQLKLGGLIGSSSGWELLQHLNSLHELEISRCKDLRQLPESMRSLTYLHKLEINWCDNLVLPEWLGELQSLERLNIIGLPLVSSLPQSVQSLTSLQDLYIYYCHALHQVPEQLGELCSLRRLQLCNLPALTSLPKSMQRLTSLHFLNLSTCDALTQLPQSLGELPALQKFWIKGCLGLTSLPCSIKRLTALEELKISYCPELANKHDQNKLRQKGLDSADSSHAYNLVSVEGKEWKDLCQRPGEQRQSTHRLDLQRGAALHTGRCQVVACPGMASVVPTPRHM
ncbi:hypothetical protein HU200_039881 [Digitaria exilis]|uniref:Uncharacterized protein n=1 Tax=Digitaria exilis TaxID=1010633 RepID=A0A835EF75_9POAL|nr:hypothetical protein HU200_039881 [Digitaria exilis]